MMGRLLTEAEARDCIDFAEGIERQDAKSIKEDRQAMNRWGEVLCTNVHHDRFDARRSACHECTVLLFDELREGKMPGEEK